LKLTKKINHFTAEEKLLLADQFKPVTDTRRQPFIPVGAVVFSLGLGRSGFGKPDQTDGHRTGVGDGHPGRPTFARRHHPKIQPVGVVGVDVHLWMDANHGFIYYFILFEAFIHFYFKDSYQFLI
jgi:hypothetical protein